MSNNGVSTYDEPTTKEMVLALMWKHDKDVYYILDDLDKSGYDILKFCKDDDIYTVFPEIGSIIYAATSVFLKGNSGVKGTGRLENAFYMGNRELRYVPCTLTFPAVKAVSSMPESIRESEILKFLYKSNEKDQVVEGCALLMQWMSLYYGMQAFVTLLPFFVQDQGKGFDIWITNTGIGKTLIAAHKYFILHYIFVAEKHYPKVYDDIMENNKEFCQVYKWLDQKSDRLIKMYDSKKYTFSCISREAINEFEEPHRLFAKEVEKKHYQKIHNALCSMG